MPNKKVLKIYRESILRGLCLKPEKSGLLVLPVLFVLFALLPELFTNLLCALSALFRVKVRFFADQVATWQSVAVCQLLKQ